MKRLFVPLVLAMLVCAAATAAAAPGTRPSVPRDVKATVEHSRAVVTFLPPASLGGSRIVHYDVVAHPTNRLFTCSATPCTISGLSSGFRYFFTVAAVNESGVGPYSSPTRKVTLRASTIKVEFSANGGEGSMADESSAAGSSAALMASTFTNPGYDFSGWNTAANGGGSSYADGATFLFSANTTLYAQWTPASFTVTFDGNGGSGAMASQTSSAGVTANLDSNSFTLAGFTFDGWNTAADGSGTSYANATPYKFVANATLYAQWIVTLVPGMSPLGLAYNWAGYAVTEDGGGYQSVGAQWAVPAVDCAATPTGHVSMWVGVNGDVGPGLFQAGTDTSCSGGLERTVAWWSDDAEGNLTQNLFLVSTGDVIHAEVSQDSSGAWSYTIDDLTTGVSMTSSESYSGKGASAEWIVEAPTNATSDSLAPLADFAPITFSNLSYKSPSGPYTAPAFADAIQMDSQSGADEAQPTAVLTLGGSSEFTVYYQSPN